MLILDDSQKVIYYRYMGLRYINVFCCSPTHDVKVGLRKQFNGIVIKEGGKKPSQRVLYVLVAAERDVQTCMKRKK